MKTILSILVFALALCGQQTQQARIVICTDAGSTDAYACSPNPAVTSYTTGLRVRLYAATANTGAASINLSALGAKAIKTPAGGLTTDLSDNDIRAGQYVELIYNGTDFQLLSVAGNAAAGGSLPSQTGNAGKVLKTDGSAAGWSSIKQTISITAPMWYLNGPTVSYLATANLSGSEANIRMPFISFADANDGVASYSFRIPTNWDGGAIDAVFDFSIGTTSAANVNVITNVACIGNTESVNATVVSDFLTNTITFTVPGSAAGILYRHTKSNLYSAASCSAGDLAYLAISRKASDNADNAAQALRLHVSSVSFSVLVQ